MVLEQESAKWSISTPEVDLVKGVGCGLTKSDWDEKTSSSFMNYTITLHAVVPLKRIECDKLDLFKNVFIENQKGRLQIDLKNNMFATLKPVQREWIRKAPWNKLLKEAKALPKP